MVFRCFRGVGGADYFSAKAARYASGGALRLTARQGKEATARVLPSVYYFQATETFFLFAMQSAR